MEVRVILLQVLIFKLVVRYSIQQRIYEGDGLNVMKDSTFGVWGSDLSIPQSSGQSPVIDPVLEFEPDFPITSLPKLPSRLDRYSNIPRSVQRKGRAYPHFLKWAALITGERVKNAMAMLNRLRLKEDADEATRDHPSLDGCTIDITRIIAPEPIFLNSDMKFMIPINGIFVFDGGDTFYVDCGDSHPGSGRVMCYGTHAGIRNRFLFNDQIVGSEAFTTCRRPFGVEIVVRNVGRCLDDQTFKAVGLLGQYGFQKLFEVCYNESAFSPSYTAHKIYGQTIYRTMHNSRGGSNFEATGMPQPFTKRILDTSYVGKIDFHKGHLTPWNDQIFQNFRLATNLYINVVPQCNANNIGNWKQLESLTLAIAGAVHDTLEVVQGTYTKIVENKVDVDLFPTTTDEFLRIPEYLWKLVKIHDGKEILFVTMNKKDLTSDQIWDVGTFCTCWCVLLDLEKFYELGGKGNNGDMACCTADDVLNRYPDFPLPRELLSDHGSHWANTNAPIPNTNDMT